MAMQGNAARYSEKRGSQALFMPCRIKPVVLKCKAVVTLLIPHVSRCLLVFQHGIAIDVAGHALKPVLRLSPDGFRTARVLLL